MSDVGGRRQGELAPGYILVVDDDKAIREALEMVLEDEGYAVASAANGREALELLRASGGLPALILLDLMMPVMNGWEFREEQQRSAALAAIPVVVLSADSDVTRKAAALGVAASLNKPVHLDVLLDVVSAYCP